MTPRPSSQYDRLSGGGSTTTSWGRNHNWNQMGRRLLKPEEVTALDARIAVTFAPGVPPLCTALARYYEERPGRAWWRAFRMRLEVWFAAVSLLALSAAAGAWLTVNLYPRWRWPWG